MAPTVRASSKLISIELDENSLNSLGNQVSFGSLFKSHRGDLEEPQAGAGGNGDGGEVIEDVRPVKATKASLAAMHRPLRGLSSFNRLIEEMEKKYSAQHLDVGEDENAEPPQDGVDSTTPEYKESEGEGGRNGSGLSATANREGEGEMDPTNPTKKPKPKKRNRHPADFYDHEDDFIDDSEIVEEVDKAHATLQTKTVHNGFFISEGDLEVIAERPFVAATRFKKVISVETKSKRRDKDANFTLTGKGKGSKGAKGKDGADGAGDKADKGKIADKASKGTAYGKESKGKRKRASKAEMDARVLEQAQAILAEQGNVAEADELAVAAAKKKRDAEKLEIIRKEQAEIDIETKALQKSKKIKTSTVVSGMGPESSSVVSTPAKSPGVKVPFDPNYAVHRALDDFKVAMTDLSCNNLALKVQIPSQVEAPLLTLDRQVRAQYGDSTKALTGYYETIVQYMGGQVTVQKVKIFMNRVQAKRDFKDTLAALFSEVEQLKLAITAGVVPFTERKKTEKKAAKAATLAAPMSEGGGEGTGDGAAMDVAEPAAATDAPTAAEDPTEPAAPAPVAPAFQTMIKWTPQMRTALATIDDLVTRSVLAHNRRLKTMSAEDKRAEGMDTSSTLDAKTRLLEVLNDLLTAFPREGCKGADISSLRAVLRGEKARAKKAMGTAGGAKRTSMAISIAKESLGEASSASPAKKTRKSTEDVVRTPMKKKGSASKTTAPKSGYEDKAPIASVASELTSTQVDSQSSDACGGGSVRWTVPPKSHNFHPLKEFNLDDFKDSAVEDNLENLQP